MDFLQGIEKSSVHPKITRCYLRYILIIGNVHVWVRMTWFAKHGDLSIGVRIQA